MIDNGLAALQQVASLTSCPCGSTLPHGVPYMPRRDADKLEIHRRRSDGVTCIWDAEDVLPFTGPVFRPPPPKPDTLLAV